MAAGDIARATGSLANTLSANLNILAGAGLVTARRDGRSIIYSAGFERMSDLLAYLMEDCCAGDPSICGPLVDVAGRAGCVPAAASC
jgi:DNA-binding transcriptional ArsR family regulator